METYFLHYRDSRGEFMFEEFNYIDEAYEFIEKGIKAEPEDIFLDDFTLIRGKKLILKAVETVSKVVVDEQRDTA